MSSHKIARSGAEGNTRLLAQYGGGSKGPRQAYATGGAVNPSLDEGLAAAGDAEMKPMKGDKGEKKSAKTNINIIVNGPDKPAAPVPMAGPPPPMPPMPPPMPPAPPMGASGMAPPMGPPMGPGGPGLPMRAKGGRVTRAMGGPVDPRAAAMGPQMSGGIQAMGPTMAPGLQAPGAPQMAPGLNAGPAGMGGRPMQSDPYVGGGRQDVPQPPMQMGRAKGGRVDKHSDAAADKKMVKAMVGKHEAAKHPGKPKTALSVGGPANPPTEKGMLAEKGFQGGGGGAIGRLEKIKKFGK